MKLADLCALSLLVVFVAWALIGPSPRRPRGPASEAEASEPLRAELLVLPVEGGWQVEVRAPRELGAPISECILRESSGAVLARGPQAPLRRRLSSLPEEILATVHLRDGRTLRNRFAR